MGEKGRKKMEEQLFTWNDWDIVDDIMFQFSDVCLVVPIGEHKVGTVFDFAVVDFSEGRLTLLKEGKEEVFSLKLSVI